MVRIPRHTGGRISFWKDPTIYRRPEDLGLAEAGAGHIDGRVETCAFFGSCFELSVATPVGQIRLRHHASQSPGAEVGVSWPDHAGAAYPADGNEPALT